jgi:F0F1-type ATP synthase gamma subunit
VPFPAISIEKEENLKRALKIKDYLIDQITKGRLGSAVIFYPKPVLFTVQQVEMVKLVPFQELFDNADKLDIGKKKIILESSLENILAYLAGMWLVHLLYEIFEESKLSEFAARAVHLEGSYQELQRINKGLKLKYFRSQHEMLDKNMRETFVANLLIQNERA